MSERKAVTLAMIAVVAVATAAGTLVLALGGGGDLFIVAVLVVGGIGVDQVSRLIMSFESQDRR